MAEDDLRADIESAIRSASGSEEAPPPEPTVAPSPEPLSEPAAAVSTDETGGPKRDEFGRFVKADPGKAAPEPPQAQAVPVPGVPEPPRAPAGAAIAAQAPPPGWSVASKALFDKLPDPVKQDIAKREAEIATGFAKLTEFKGLDEYANIARSNGTTLPDAIGRYVAAENFLETNPVGGILWMCERFGVHPSLLLQAIGQGAGTPPAPAPYQTGAPAGNQTPQGMDGVMGYLQALNNRVALFEQEKSQALDQAINSEIQQFEADPAHRYFPNVRVAMGRLIAIADQTGQDMSLQEAYDRACWADPEIRPHLINEVAGKSNGNGTTPPKRVAGSLAPGSPIPGGTLAASEPAATLREEIQRAFNEHRL